MDMPAVYSSSLLCSRALELVTLMASWALQFLEETLSDLAVRQQHF
jgi:hypothetical protein